MHVRRLEPADADVVLAAGQLFDTEPKRTWTEHFLNREGHHLYMAFAADTAVGFVTGVEITHPDKGTEMLVYELGVDEAHRRRGIGRALVKALAAAARAANCYGMWVPIEPDNVAAVATYLAAGAEQPVPAATMVWTFG